MKLNATSHSRDINTNNIGTYHIEDIVMATTQFTRIVSHIIDSNHDSPTGSRGSVGDQIKIGIDIEGIARGQLRNLGVSLALQLLPHGRQDLGKAQVVFGDRFVLVQNLQERRRASPSGMARGIGQRKGIHVGHIGRRLMILAARNLKSS